MALRREAQGEGLKHVMIIGSFARSLVNFRGDLIQDLIKAGWLVTAAAPNLTSDVKDRLRAYGAEVVEIPLERSGLNPLRDLINLSKITRIIKDVNPSLVLTYTIKPNIWGTIAADKLGLKSIAMVTGVGYAFTDSKKPSVMSQFVRFAARKLYAFATSKNNAVIFQNPDDRADFIQYGCLKDGSKAHIVNGSGVNMEQFKRVALPSGAVCLMIGRLHKNKGIREYGEAAAMLKEKFPDARFLIVGYFDEGPDSIKQADMDGWVARGVEFLGRKEDVREAISLASVYVLPSYREGTPRSTLESMAMGRSIVTADSPGCRETVIDGETGFIVPVGDVKALAAKMERLIVDGDLRAEMGENSYQLCREKYDVRAVNRAVIKVLSS